MSESDRVKRDGRKPSGEGSTTRRDLPTFRTVAAGDPPVNRAILEQWGAETKVPAHVRAAAMLFFS